ncbi:MAG: flavodoxin-dependent (E)-4-hydroxy-3-methylbut-2-enyl-diphosphate synthase [Desulfovibrio sp.]|jgi:(E)-4-hydroxy-3-methylbut-2-enyl-diphosphate synthase|nr:flavodoxin-dependent (E)-4-hydroxy-3-methylbut-2-enyl-diphosphate synthase [Desulfovibrio sp.]
MDSPSRRGVTRRVTLGSLAIGGGAPVVVQSMTNTDTRDPEATLAQIARLAARGCEAVRVAVPDDAAVKALPAIRAGTSLPLIADIHFDWRLAVASIEAGLEGARINPGNIGSRENLFRVADAAAAHGALLRIGVNGGSLEKSLLEKFGGATPEALAQSALAHARLLEDRGFGNFKVSIKSSNVLHCIDAYRRFAKASDCPLHIGVTEAGGLLRGTVKSAVGLGILLHEGIGDTLRVSLTADPVQEVAVAWELLRALGLRSRGPEIISCPTCGRTEIDLMGLLDAVETALEGSTADLKVAVMGCVVNGPGEARDADIGVAGGRDRGIVFRDGRVVRSVKGRQALLDAFLEELAAVAAERVP